ncbi:uncharacterized protein A4U43_C04F25420 [Asparagus officinalis]|uniref:BTB domain-containing protein n=1 Tax=Asparagus officinalis TaxID=4686 RepID=A0A5P1F8H8_ASPOF|nr:uncharacterized protein A4U43_C04F25420 [Asparagus officinalis]
MPQINRPFSPSSKHDNNHAAVFYRSLLLANSKSPSPSWPLPLTLHQKSPSAAGTKITPLHLRLGELPCLIPPTGPRLDAPPWTPRPHLRRRSSSRHHPSSYTKFNSALNAGLLNPMSPPPTLDKQISRSSPTLFDMMANEHDYHPRSNPNPAQNPNRQLLLQDRIAEILATSSPGNQFNDLDSSDVRLTLSSKDGLVFSLNVHRQILVAHSRFFAGKLSDRWSKQQRSLPHLVEISDCDDVEVYIETLRLMYCRDLRRRLMREDVSKIADEFLRTWAAQTELSSMHAKIPAMYRYEVSRVTARLLVGIGKGQILVSKEVRCLLLRTWLEAFYEDFGWMRRACK